MTLRYTTSLLDLTSDVLIQILEELRPHRQLRDLSQSCRAFRSLAMPVLFRDCIVWMDAPITSKFLPISLWPYVRSLRLVDRCPLRQRGEWKHRTDAYVYSLRYSNDPLLCGALDAGVLRRSLPEMPRLYSFIFSLNCGEVHGIRDDVAAALLSAPQIRDVHILSFLFCPRRPIPHGASRDMQPLTSFRYTKHPFHPPPRSHPSEVEAVRMVVGKLHASLEVLKLPVETTPLDAMSRLYWPRLHTLVLHGESPTAFPVPIIAVICRMPRLRILTLELSILPNTSRQCVWPRNWTVDDALPHIEELTVTHPHPEDLLYTHLPTSIRRLSLCCSPCYALQLWCPDEYRRWKSPLPSASDLLRILLGSSMPSLTHLSIDYRVDCQEEEFLQHLSNAYPHLTSLELHRMGDTPLAWPEDIATVAFVTQNLSRLRCLDMLRLNLNMTNSSGSHHNHRKLLVWLRTRSLEIAQAIAPMLAPSVTVLCLLTPASAGVVWREYSVSATEVSDCAVLDTASSQAIQF